MRIPTDIPRHPVKTVKPNEFQKLFGVIAPTFIYGDDFL